LSEIGLLLFGHFAQSKEGRSMSVKENRALRVLLSLLVGVLLGALLLLAALVFWGGSQPAPGARRTTSGDIVIELNGDYLTRAAAQSANGIVTAVQVQPQAGDKLDVTAKLQTPLVQPLIHAQIAPVVEHGGVRLDVLSVGGIDNLPSPVSAWLDTQIQPAVAKALKSLPTGYQLSAISTTNSYLVIVLNPPRP
jgi:hypothetical protein